MNTAAAGLLVITGPWNSPSGEKVLVTAANTGHEVQFSSSDSFPLAAGSASLLDLILRDPVEFIFGKVCKPSQSFGSFRSLWKCRPYRLCRHVGHAGQWLCTMQVMYILHVMQTMQMGQAHHDGCAFCVFYVGQEGYSDLAHAYNLIK